MFSTLGWKRQRREVECATLSTSPASVADAALELAASSDSCCGSASSAEADGDFLRESYEALARVGAAAAAAGSQGTRAHGRLMEAACASGRAAVAAGREGQGPGQLATVRARAAYFEALIRSNTTTYVQCHVDDRSPSSRSGGSPSSSDDDCSGGRARASCAAGSADDMLHLEARDAAAAEHGQCAVSASGAGTAEEGGAGDVTAGEGEGTNDYSEVHLVFRMPRGPRGPSPSAAALHAKYGSVEQMGALIEQLTAQLAVAERGRAGAARLAVLRGAEVDNLTRVVKELSDARAKVQSAKASLHDKYCDLQAEYHRMLRIADLSRTVSKENIAKTSRTRKQLQEVELELRATRLQADKLREKSAAAKVENLLLKERMSLLERLAIEEAQESVCIQQFSRSSIRVTETY